MCLRVINKIRKGSWKMTNVGSGPPKVLKFPFTLAISAFMSSLNFMLSWVEHGKSCITAGPGAQSWDCAWLMISAFSTYFLIFVMPGKLQIITLERIIRCFKQLPKPGYGSWNKTSMSWTLAFIATENATTFKLSKKEGKIVTQKPAYAVVLLENGCRPRIMAFVKV